MLWCSGTNLVGLFKPTSVAHLLKLNQCQIQTPRQILIRNCSYATRFRHVSPRNYALLLLPSFTLYLGIWQVRRRKWKLSLIEELDRKQRMPGVALPDALTDLTVSREYETFILNGEFDHSRETFIGPRTLIGDGAGGGLISSSDSIGAHVITPLRLNGREEQVLVNRGWIPIARQRSGEIYRPTGQVELEGVLRLTERGAKFTSAEQGYDKRTRMWSRRHNEIIADTLGTEPYVFDAAEVPPPLKPASPIPGQTIVQLRNEHLSYIITWFSLTALMLFIWSNRFLRPRSSGVHDLMKAHAQKKRQA